MKERGLSYYGILTNCRDNESGEYRKEVMLYSQSPSVHGFMDFMKYLDTHEGFKLHDRNEVNEDDGLVVAWQVGNIKYSRKDFEKIMTHFYTNDYKL